MQWMSLVLLTVGCMIKELKTNEKTQQKSYGLFISLLLMFTQIFCSCLAGVYNEYLLKKGQGINVNVYVQNIFMYIDSIFCNVLLLLAFNKNETNLSNVNIFGNYLVRKINY